MEHITPVIIDTDPGVDDIIAILFALASPELRILAYIVTFGNTEVDHGYANILKAYYALHKNQSSSLNNKQKPLLIRGCESPLEGEVHSAQYFHGRDGLGNISQHHLDLTPSPEDVDLIFADYLVPSPLSALLDILRSADDDGLTYVALGPLTTLATLWRTKDGRELFCRKVRRVVSMGGALDVPGNTSAVAEFNFFADPFAVKELITQSNFLDRFVLCPLDITTPHELPFPVYEERVAHIVDPLVHFTSSFLQPTRTIMCSFGKDAMELHDIVAVWCAFSDGADGWETTRRVFGIERYGELTRGMCVVDRREDEGAFQEGDNRAEAEARRSAVGMPALVEMGTFPVQSDDVSVRCLTKTPGPNVLLALLLERVWGVV